MIDLELTLKPLSPVHIGTGDEIDPLSYFIEKETFYRIDLDRLLSLLSPEENRSLIDLIDKMSPLEVRSWLERHAKSHNAVLYEAATTKRVSDEYESHKRDLNNQMLVHTLVRDSLDAVPIIPGSSLKGSIRTAVVNRFAEGVDIQDQRNLEPQVLGYLEYRQGRPPRVNLNADPFRCLRIPDVQFAKEDVILHRLRNVKPAQQRTGRVLEERSFNVVAETIRPGGDGKRFRLQFDADLDKQPGAHFQKHVPASFEELRNCANNFYLETLGQEEKNYYRETEVMKFVSRLREEAGKTDRFLLRVGRFSGVFSVTLHKHRQPHVRPIRGQRVYGKTCYLTESQQPLGWVVVQKAS